MVLLGGDGGWLVAVFLPSFAFSLNSWSHCRWNFFSCLLHSRALHIFSNLQTAFSGEFSFHEASLDWLIGLFMAKSQVAVRELVFHLFAFESLLRTTDLLSDWSVDWLLDHFSIEWSVDRSIDLFRAFSVPRFVRHFFLCFLFQSSQYKRTDYYVDPNDPTKAGLLSKIPTGGVGVMTTTYGNVTEYTSRTKTTTSTIKSTIEKYPGFPGGPVRYFFPLKKTISSVFP